MLETFLNGRVTLHTGDSRDVLRAMPAESVDSVACDPPYAFESIVKRFGGEGAAAAKGGVYSRSSSGFMGKKWDTGEVAFDPEFWGEVFRVLRPGGYLAAFGATRTYHRLAGAIEAAGFEIRDMIAWLYGSGFPKSTDFAAVPGSKRTGRVVRPELIDTPFAEGFGTALKPALEPLVLAQKPFPGPIYLNVATHGVGGLNIDGCRVKDGTETGGERPVYEANGKNAVYGAGMGGGDWENVNGRWPANVVHDGSDEVHETLSAARFFYSAKADVLDRLGSKHPTVKPLDLMQWLCRLITPPGGVVLDPFAGTGSTGEAAWREGFSAVLIEREAEYADDIRRRMALATSGEKTRRRAAAARRPADQDLGIFGELEQ